jgi:hypothetical protein
MADVERKLLKNLTFFCELEDVVEEVFAQATPTWKL